MALESPASYPVTLIQFLTHWESVDAELVVPLVLLEGDRAAGLALGAELNAAMHEVVNASVQVTLAREFLVDGREQVRGLLDQFNAAVRTYWPGTPWAALVPRLPPAGAALDKYLRPCREAARLWALLEAEPAPPGAPVPILIGQSPGVGLAAYEAALEEVRLLGLALEAAEWALSVARARRNGVMLRVRAMLVSYTRALPSRLPAGHALLESMPRLWPLPGHTPDPVRAAGEWLPAEKRARLTWSESKDEALDHYEVRVCPGLDYNREDEVVLATVPPDAPRELVTGQLLSKPGTAASFRVYVVLRTENARASNVVSIRHPEE